MITLNKQRPQHPKGDQLWRNPTNRTLKIKLYAKPNAPPDLHTLKPGDTIKFPVWWAPSYIRRICRFLVPAGGHDEPAPPPPPSAPPPEAEEPLGDPEAVQSADDRREGKEAKHTSGDALEAYAQTLMKKPKDELRAMAEDMGIDAGRPITKAKLARAIALKSVEGD